MNYKVSPQILTRMVPKDKVESLVPALRKLEKVFPAELEMSTKEVRESVTRDGAVVFVAEHNGRVIGASYCNTMESIDEEFFDGYWNPREWDGDTGAERSCRSLYVTSTAVHPRYRRLGIAMGLKLRSLSYLRTELGLPKGYILGHANSGPMTKTYLALGGEKVKLFRYWYGSGENHWLCQIWSGRFGALWPVPPVKQANDWDCGVACAAQLGWYFNGKYAPDLADYRSIYQFCVPSRKDGTPPGHIVQAFGMLLSKAHYMPESDISDLMAALRKGPVMVNFQSRWGGHYVNMIGFSGDTLYYWDVADARVKHILGADFEKRWYSKRYGRRIMIVPERI